jgi:serine/threonine protein kinase
MPISNLVHALPFYPWLRQLAWERLIELHRRHIQAKKRTVSKEEPLALPEDSALELVARLAADESPSAIFLREEMRARIHAALAQLVAHDLEILVLRHLEQLSTSDTAAVLGLTESGVGISNTGDLLGTLRYMSPEQALGARGEVGPRTDIYALGATLYELLPGESRRA